ncbi:MAG: hypothetical protein PHU25_11865 [Deltaproteobacteria bacterium]|nr:hypothetical protein [Deltaproteobacteria bacterium]
MPNNSNPPPPQEAERGGEDSSIFERVMPESVRRGLEALLHDSRFKNIIGDFKLPKEIVSHILAQVDETKHAALGVIAREMRLFLERTNLADEMARLLTQVSFQIKTEVRFVPNDKRVPAKEAPLVETSLREPKEPGSCTDEPAVKDSSAP